MVARMTHAVLDDLKAQIASRRAVLVVGSGVSVAATNNAPAASWTGLLKHGVERCVELDGHLAGDWHDRTLADVTSGRLDDLLAGASKVRRTLCRQNEWSRWLEDTIGTLKASRFELIDALGSLNAPILTTNYDDLLERRLHRHAITWMDKADQIAFARVESCETVLHLHGFWRQPDTVILDGGDYERILGAQLAQAGLRTLGEAWSLVFVGCGDGLADPNFEQFLDWMAVVLKGVRHRHFRLERKTDADRRQQWHNDRGHHVRVVTYGDAYDDLPAFIESLRPSGTARVSTTGHAPAAPIPERVTPLARPVLSAGEYVRLQQKGREAVGRLTALARQLEWESIGAHGNDLSQTLEQDLYRVAITGRSRAGKSSLVNALVGRTICPVERVITTAIPIIIGPGENESATIKYQPNGRSPLHLDGPITADMLAPYADQRYNRDNEKRVDRIEVRLGHQVLDLGVEYVDIPGFDDPSGRIWSATQEVIGKAHALVLVLDVSSYESGGFTIDKATREVLEQAHKRACPVLVVCNKADKLSKAEREEAKQYVLEKLDHFGLRTALVHGPFLMSTKEALEARAGNEPLPMPFSTFEAALWEQLWNTESVGLRRLFRVFDALRVADEEVDALMAARQSKGSERERLHAAFARCQQDKANILATCRHDSHALRQRTAEFVESARSKHLHAIAAHVASLPVGSEIPLVSETVQAFQERLAAACRTIIENVTPSVAAQCESTEKAVTRSLSILREEAGLSAQARQARVTLVRVSQFLARLKPLPSRNRVVARGGFVDPSCHWGSQKSRRRGRRSAGW
jgi:GTP-binding protein EngB required for normal cell division